LEAAKGDNLAPYYLEIVSMPMLTDIGERKRMLKRKAEL
jgi:hypothetical protein